MLKTTQMVKTFQNAKKLLNIAQKPPKAQKG